MAFCNSEYFDQIGNIQKNMHERERRRLELEEKLFDYLRSEERLTKLKCAKMRCYYKELREREQQAKIRNLELLGNVENLASKMKEFSTDCSRLLQKRLEYKNHITRLKKDRKKMASRGESEADELPSRFQLPSIQGSSQSGVIFTGHQTSNGSSRNDGVITTCSPSQTDRPNHPSLSPLQSGFCIHSHVSKASATAILSDDILNSGDFLKERHLSDVCEKQMESDWDISQRAGERHRCEELNSPHMTLKEDEVSSQSVTMKKPADIVSLERYLTRSPSPETTDPRDSSQYINSGGEDEEGDSTPTHQDLSDDTNSRHHDLRGDVVIQEQSVIPLQTKSGTHKQVNTQESGRPDSLESPNSICGQCGRLDGVELHSCGAVVLQQLPLLSCSLSHGSLLPNDLINTHWSSATKPEQIRSCLSAESALLWDCCFRHFFQLQQQKILSTDHIIQLFTPLLVPNNATYTEKAGEMLKRLLTHESETHQPSESELSSSCSLPSLLDYSVEIKPARPSKTNEQTVETEGIQSAEEDSADQSPVESIPIRETKAYQLLKQSVAQERHWSDSEEENSEPSDINKLERSEALRESLTQNSRKIAKSKAFSAVQSKAFWGESDDSNSEIEMALRPQSRNTSSHDFDDFYD
uniref:Centrosomal protein kizuna n=1 Tax=Cyprinus carpio TaxID=7962 RepID=A0A8C1TY37_CYPCA